MSARSGRLLGRRGGMMLGLLVAGLGSAVLLGLRPSGLVPNEGGLEIAGEFFAAALRPAFTYEAEFVPSGAGPFLVRVVEALWRTVLYAAAAMSLAVPAGLLLGFLASSQWWAADSRGNGSRRIGPLVQTATRVLIGGMRSIHELLWAVVFLVAFGLSSASACFAIAIPYAGTLAKVYSEILDEAPYETARAVRATGAGHVTTFVVGLFPRALPDMAGYTFYRFECAVRSSAILGFFGYETLGYYLAASFENVQYREVWTYLYALFALVGVFELWSGSLRKRVVV